MAKLAVDRWLASLRTGRYAWAVSSVHPTILGMSLLLLGAASCGKPTGRTTTPASSAEMSADATEGETKAGSADEGSSGDRPHPAWMVEAADKLHAHVRKTTPRAWDRLAFAVDTYGHRLSGSQSLEQAIMWAMNTMASDGLENARREQVMVPHWVRGEESVEVIAPVKRELVMLGLGGSVGTRNRPLRGEVVVVDHVDEVSELGAKAKGKIVLINQEMPEYDMERHESGYGETVQARTRGASEAAKLGAKAVLVRSVTAYSLRTPHTGAVRYEDGVEKIPAAALTLEDAEFLARMVKRGKTRIELRMGARNLGEAESANVVAELPGRELRDEVVVIGGHIDSWDVGDGSTDDMSGCIMAMEAALMLQELDLVPRRTIRVVLFTNEENGLRGAQAYYEEHGEQTHVAAIEADSGSASPMGFSVSGTEGQVEAVSELSPLFLDLGASTIIEGWGGADMRPLAENNDVLSISVRPDGSRYFDVHHSPADTVEKIEPRHLQANAAAMALMAYILAEQKQPLGAGDSGP